jgi:hypothetical protein
VLLLQLRDFLERPDKAPDALRSVLGALPDGLSSLIVEHVPRVAWPYWIVLGTAISFAVGLLGRGRRPADDGRRACLDAGRGTPTDSRRAD